MLKLIYFKSLEDRDKFSYLVRILPNDWYCESVANVKDGWVLHFHERCEHIYNYLLEHKLFEEYP